jgi:DNA replication and repair protein RecF
MDIGQLTIQGFRNLQPQTLNFLPGAVIIWGENGQGKTNLLEAIYLACTAELWRANKEAEAIAWEQELARVTLRAAVSQGSVATEAAFNQTGNSLLKINGVLRKRGDFVGLLPVVTFSGEDLFIIKGEPSHRRQFLNRELSQINRSYRWNLLHFRRTLEQRNRLLKEIREGRQTKDSLGTWEAGLVKYGAKLIALRSRFLADLAPLAEAYLVQLHPGWRPLELVYQPALGGSNLTSQALAALTPEAVGELLQQGFEQNREEEIARGFSLVGPQRDDFDLRVGGIDQRQYGSQGQQRSLALALKLGLAKMVAQHLEEQPVLLLDDVLSELDESRRRGLLAAIGERQWFLTTAARWEIPAEFEPQGQYFQMQEGRLSGANG